MQKPKWPSMLLSIAVLTVLLPFAGCTGDSEEKVLNMYVAYGGPEIVADEFEKATGIKVNFLPMSSGEVLTRLKDRREGERPHGCGRSPRS